jgi:sigma-B regulation protein RsbU (phosphoserine phosphatase)
MSLDEQRGADAGVAAGEPVVGGLRLWLRRVMPRVALAAVVLFVVRLLVQNTSLYRDTPLHLLGPVTFCLVSAVIIYYSLKGLRRLKQLLLWRVRRRLIVTYLFVGLTPVVLLTVLGYFAAIIGSRQVMVRVVTVQFNSTQRQVAENARALAEELSKMPATTADRAVQAWLDERAGLLQASLPGARVALWREPGGAARTKAVGHDAPARFLSGRGVEAVEGGRDSVVVAEPGEPLPEWLEGLEEWDGLAFIPLPPESKDLFGTPSMRAFVRRRGAGGDNALLLVVPVTRPFVQRMRESTGLRVRPYFLGIGGFEGGRQGAVEVQETRAGEQRMPVDFKHDQFGDALPDGPFLNWYPVFLPATNWLTSEQKSRWAFVVDWSWAEGGKQFWGDAALGPVWRRVLYVVSVLFLVLELLALLSAAWMTRAVTGTVHKLHQATQSVKRGDFSHRIRTRSRDQLSELAVAFNEMSSEIEVLLAERVVHERLEREIEIAAEVQAQLFPRSVPALSTVEMTGECRAARGVAGDYYDYVEAAPGLVAFALGDVSGKGISASLVMSNLQATLRAQVAIISERLKIAAQQQQSASAGGTATGASVAAATQTATAYASQPEGRANEPPCGVAGLDRDCAVANMTANINDQLCRSTESNRFATLFLALYDDRTRLLRYTNAGHNSPLLVRSDGSIERLLTGGTMVGAFDWVKFEEGRVTLEEGDLLVVFSDGLSEAQNQSGEEYGEERLSRFVTAHREETVENLRTSLFNEVDTWSGSIERGDDQTLVILKAVNGKS